MSNSTYSNRNIRDSLRAFALGKVLTAPGSILLVFLYATFMAREQYAAYVAATAVLEVSMSLGTCGIDWLTQTVIPSIRVKGTNAQLRAAVRRLIGLQVIPYCLLGIGILVLAPWLSRMLSGVVPAEVLRIYGVVVAVEGVSRLLRDQILGALMMQRMVQLLQIFRLVLMLGGLCALHFLGPGVTAWHVAFLELSASVGTVLIAGVALAHHLRSAAGVPGDDRNIGAWFGRGSVRFAFNAYCSFLLSICIGTELATGLVARYLGADATAQFGFATRLVEQVRRFLPLDLVWVVIRPALIGRFERQGRNFAVLSNDVGLILRANLLLLGIAAVVFIGAGSELVLVFTHGNIHLMPFLLASLLPLVLGHTLRRSLELMTYLIGRSNLFLYGSLATIAAPLLLLTYLDVFKSLYLVGVAIGVAELLCSVIVFAGLARSGHPVQVTPSVWLKLIGIVLACGAVGMFSVRQIPGPAGVVSAVVAAVALYLAGIVIGRIVSRTDIDAVKRMLAAREPAAPAVGT